MSKNNPKIYRLVLIVLCFAYVNSQAQSSQIKLSNPNTPTYFTNAQGDTIPFGVPLPISGTLVPPDSIQPPKDYGPVEFNEQNTLTHPNVQTVGERVNAKIYTTPATPAQLAYLKNFSRDTLEVPITVTPIKQPKAIPALGVGRREAALENFSFIQEAHGLPDAKINDLHEDRFGNLWIATDNGLTRYDGVNFFHFTQEEGLTNPKLLKIITDGKGSLWFITPTGVEKYDGKNFTFFDTSEILFSITSNFYLSFAAWSLTEDGGLDYLFADKQGGVVSFDGTHFLKYPIVNGIKAKEGYNSPVLAIGKQKQMWFKNEKGLLSFNGTTFTHYEIEGQVGLDFPQLDSQGNLWLSRSYPGRLYRFSKEAVIYYPLKFKKEGHGQYHMVAFLEDKKGNLWFGGYGKRLFKLPADQKLATPATFIEYGTQEGMAGFPISSIMENKQGTIWIGTYRGGLYKINNLKFAHYTPKEGVTDGAVIDLVESKNGNLIFLPANYGLLFYDGKNFIKSLKVGASSKTLLKNEAGDLWVGHNGYGSTHLKNQQGQLIARHYWFQSAIKGIVIMNILQDNRENLWFNAITHPADLQMQGGLTYYNPRTEEFSHLSREEGLISNSNYALLLDKKGNLWFGADGTISRMQLDTTIEGAGGEIIHYPISNEAIKPQKVQHFLEDSQQRIWMGTDKGVVLYTPSSLQDSSTKTLNDQLKQFSFFTTADGLFYENVKSIIEDKNQNIWITTEKGITVLQPVQANTNQEGPIKLGNDTYRYVNFGKKDGMRDNNFYSSHLAKNNRLWWGNREGLMYLDLDDFELPSQAPQHIQLTQLDINNEFINFPNLADSAYQNTLAFGPQLATTFDSIVPLYNYPVGLTLPHKLNHLTFHFSAIDWTAPHQIEYSYKIEGIDEEWSTPNTEAKVDYRNLPHGDFTFNVKAKGIAQIWSEPFAYSFTILPPWWLTWWAKALYFLAGIAAIIGYNKWRTNALKKRQVVLEETVTERTKEVVEEKNKSEALLLNILPSEVANELKKDGESPARDFNEVTVLFTDFKEFTIISEQLSARDLVAELNVCFKAFDEIITRYGIEKIKTIGDAYLAAGGLQLTQKTSPADVVKAALDMQTFIQKRKKERTAMGLPGFEMRCGIHTGPVVAGIVGVKKFQYDIWGDTVNIASRMESNGEVGKVNLSGYAYQLVKDNPAFSFAARGKVAVKNKGEIEMYYVDYLVV